MKSHAPIAALLLVAFALGSCQTRETSPTQPMSENDIGIAARLVANHPLPAASRVRARVATLPDGKGTWVDVPYQSGRTIELGTVVRGSDIVLDVRAYSLRSPLDTLDTLWKWFSRTTAKADAPVAVQLVDAVVDTVPSATGLASLDPSGVILPAGSRYTLDGSDPSQSSVLSSGTPIVVATGAVLRAKIRFQVPGTTEYLDGDTLRVNGKPAVVPPPEAPQYSMSGNEVPDQVAVGDVIRILAPTGTRLAYTTDATAPTCAGALLGNEATVTITASQAGKSLVLTSISCKDTSKSVSKERTVAVAALGQETRPQIGVPAGYDSAASTATIPWDTTVNLGVPTGTTLRWKVIVVRSSSNIDAVTWTALGLPGRDDSTSAKVRVDPLLLRSLPKTDSVATALAVAILLDPASQPLDTARLRWTIEVPYIRDTRPAKPKTTVNGGSLPDELDVGATIQITADTGSRPAFTLDGSEPSCARKASRIDTAWVVDSARSGTSVVLQAISCRDTAKSLVDSHTVKIAQLGQQLRIRLQIPAQYDPVTATAQVDWTIGATLLLPARTSLIWNLRLIPVSAQPSAADWAACGLPTSSNKTGSSNVLQVKRELLANLDPTDSILTVLAKAILLDADNQPLDTARLRWDIIVPPIPKPLLTATPGLGRVSISWPVTAGTLGANAWAWIGNATDPVAVKDIAVGPDKDSFTVALAAGQKVRVAVASIDAATGRSSARSTAEASAFLPPNPPKFQVANTDPVEGTVEVDLDSSTRAETGVTWTVGYATSGSPIDFTAGEIDASGHWSAKVNAGGWKIGVRASRDGEVSDSVTTLVVSRTKGLSPASVQGLATSRTDSSSVVWKWTRVPGRAYRVFVLRGGSFSKALDTANCLASDVSMVGNLDSFKIAGLAPGAKVSVAVVALAGVDSANGNAQPSFANLAATLVPPPTPAIVAQNSNPATGEVTVSVTNFDAGSVWSLGIDPLGGTNFAWSNLPAATATRTLALNGTANLRVQAVRDGYTKSTTASLAVKNTNLLAPSAPGGLSWVRKTTSLELRWTSLPGHTYRLFWDNGTGSGNLDTTASTKINKGPDSIHIFTTTAGQTVRIALQTISAPDSTKPSAPTFDRKTALATIDPVETISSSFNASTRIATFTWPAVPGAVKYGYTSNLQGAASQTTSPLAAIAYTATTTDISVTVWAVNADGVVSTNRTASLHIPTNVGTTNLLLWPMRTKGNTLLVEGRASGTIVGTAPDSVVVFLKNGPTAVQTWRMTYDMLASFTATAVLDSAPMNAGAYRLQAQFRWTSGSLKGDSTSLDSRSVVGLAGTIPNPVFRIDDGKTVITVRNYGAILPGPTGWTPVVLAEANGTWTDILDNDHPDVFPSLRSGGGTGAYPLGTNRLMVYYTNGQDTSVVRVVDVGYSAFVTIGQEQYPTVTFGSQEWIVRPMKAKPAAGNFCSDQTIADDCGSAGRLYSWLEAMGLSSYPADGDHKSASIPDGACPDGFRIPYTLEAYAMLAELSPGWTWSTSGDYNSVDLMKQAKFDFQVSSKEDPSSEYWNYATFWAASTNTYYGQSGYHDAIYSTGYAVTGIARRPDFNQIATVYCVRD